MGQLHRDDLFLLPRSAKANFLVVGARLVEEVTIDGVAPAGWVVGQAVMVAGTSWAARRGPIGEGAHRMTGSAPFGGLACGSGPVGCNAFVGGAAVKRIDDSPPIQWPGGPPPPVRRRARPGSPEDSSRGHLVSTRRGPRGALSLAAAPA